LLVIGSASVGLYAVAFARALAVRCTYVDADPKRSAIAERLGATVITTTPDGRRFGEFAVTASCNSTAGGLQSAIRSTAAGGTCQAAGIHFRVPELPLLEMYRRGITLVTGRAGVRDDLPEILELIRQGRFNPADIEVATILVDDAPEALQAPLGHKTVVRMA
jgi:alcohol dehydrogenase